MDKLTTIDKILFLDIDGVLNSHQFYRDRKENYDKAIKEINGDMFKYDLLQIDHKQVKMLSDFVVKNKLHVVLSSTWRIGKTVEYMNELFKELGAEFEFYDFTPVLRLDKHKGYTNSIPRGFEIHCWMSKHVECGYKSRNFIILDDDSDFLLWQERNFFNTDICTGLTDSIIYRMQRFLDGY